MTFKTSKPPNISTKSPKTQPNSSNWKLTKTLSSKLPSRFLLDERHGIRRVQNFRQIQLQLQIEQK